MAKNCFKKSFNIPMYQINVNYNYFETLPYQNQNDYHQKKNPTANVGEGVEQEEPLFTAGGGGS